MKKDEDVPGRAYGIIFHSNAFYGEKCRKHTLILIT
jgi:hypothetical protein